MVDLDPQLRGAYQEYKAAKAAKEAVLARINARSERLVTMPAPLNLAINFAQLLGFEYEHRPKDMRDLDEKTALAYWCKKDIERQLTRTPGEYPLAAVSYHPNAMINMVNGKPYPWVVHFRSKVEEDYFNSDVSAEKILVRKASEPLVQVRPKDTPILHLPDGYRMRFCTEPEWRCQDEDIYCQSLAVGLTGLSEKPTLLNLPDPRNLR